MRRRSTALAVWFALFFAAALLAGSALNLLPPYLRIWFGYIAIPAAVLWFLYSWFRWHRKTVGNSKELEWLDELVQEHENGARDNSATLRRLIPDIEHGHKLTPDVANRLERARRALQNHGVRP